MENTTQTATGIEQELRGVEGLRLETDVSLSQHTRFGIGGSADLFGWASTQEALSRAVLCCQQADVPFCLMGEGSNVVVADEGFRGLVLRVVADKLAYTEGLLHADAGVSLQSLVNLSLAHGLEGLHTLTGIPGSVGGAVYGNAGAYGHSLQEFVKRVEFFDGSVVSSLGNSACDFEYRESIFKRHKDWLILSTSLELPPGVTSALRQRAAEIRILRDEKFPPELLCAGSIFKNLYLASLPAEAVSKVPEQAVRGGKVAAAYFLEQVGAKGMNNGGIGIAPYHANLLYNRGGGTAAQVRELVQELKSRIRERFGFEVEEEVQYIG